MGDLSGKTVVVVGASGVLGGLISAELTERGVRVIASAHSLEGQNRARTVADTVIPLDIASESSIAEFTSAVRDSVDAIDGIVIATGVAAFGPMAETPAEIVSKVMAVNATGPISVITHLLPLFREGGDSFVVTLSGKIAEIPTAGLAAYSAAKTALHAYSVAAGREIRRAGVRWVDARPGHTETGFADRAVHGIAPDFGQGMEPRVVAERIVRGIADGERDLPSTAFIV
jgi:cyclic-di-GMP-binding biofilm dispersal mediator protein